MVKIAVVTPAQGVDSLFLERFDDVTVVGGGLVGNLDAYDFVVFTGGADISPSLYGATPHSQTYPSRYRDEIDTSVYNACNPSKTKFIGICRGAQFLTAMYGGVLNQHVEKHVGYHPIITDDKRSFKINSVHHQTCLPKDGTAEIFGVSPDGVNEAFLLGGKDLCVQFHPEYGHGATTNYFWELFERVYPDVLKKIYSEAEMKKD
jgi:gamma-glutamyl-gamma-aminobutyrate hydrolase PuuD